MTTVTAPAGAGYRRRPAGALSGVAVVTGRNLRRLVRVPTLLVFATVQPVLFVLLFTYAFGGAVHVPGTARYIDYLLPGIFVLSIGFGASQTGVAIDEAAGRVVLPVADGAAVLPAVAGRLAAAGLQVSALALRRPTLEEAFLALTGHGAGRPPTDTSGPDGVAAGRQLTDAGGSTS